MAFIDKTGLQHLWGHTVERLNEKADIKVVETLATRVPEVSAAHQQLVTDGDGNAKWEEKLAYKDVQVVDVLKDATTEIKSVGPNFNRDVEWLSEVEVGDKGVLYLNGVPYEYTAEYDSTNITGSIIIRFKLDNGPSSPAIYRYPCKEPAVLALVLIGATGKTYTISITKTVTTIKTFDTDLMGKNAEANKVLVTDENGEAVWSDSLPEGVGGSGGTSAGSSLPLEVGSNGKSLRTTWSAKEDDTYKLGQNAFAFGNSAKASGAFSIALGPGSQATGSLDFAEGAATQATGGQSHAEGSSTTASGGSSHAEGSSTTASGPNSHAEGAATNATKGQDHAEGMYTTASGGNSHAEGNGTTASGTNSHAEGASTTASGSGSHAEGGGTTASSDYQHVQGKSNIPDSEGKYAHIVGNGESSNAQSNAHTLDWDGNAWYAGDIYVGGTSQDDAAAERLARTSDIVAPRDYIALTDQVTGKIYRLTMENGSLVTTLVEGGE